MATVQPENADTAPDPEDPRKPDSPTDLTKQSAFYVVRETAREFQHDQCTDLAAALTYYAVHWCSGPNWTPSSNAAGSCRRGYLPSATCNFRRRTPASSTRRRPPSRRTSGSDGDCGAAGAATDSAYSPS